MAQKLISMAEEELFRYEVIQDLTHGLINGTDASKQLGLSVRQVKRLKARVIKFGAKGLVHGNRGRKSNHKLDPKIVNRAKGFLRSKYPDFGPTFAAEKLDENHNIQINKETVRAIMTNMGLWKPRPKKQSKKKHSWRARKDNFGEMQQFDGSYHKWFGEDESCLLLSIDDATGKITHGQFDYNESTLAVFDFWWGYFLKNGLPISIYLDKFSTYKINHPKAVDNKDLITQFERAMNQAGARLITAHSAEAKGRIERMFETLQDRLVKELRLAGITTMEEANEFLQEYIPKFNTKFAVVPRRRKNLHKKINQKIEERLPQIFSIQNERTVNNDYTIMFKNKFFQLNETQPTTVYKKNKVMVEEHLNGVIKINFKGHYLNFLELPERPRKEINIKLPALTRQKPSGWKPPSDHPWRKYPLIIKKQIRIEQLVSNYNN